jgi:hypothetical protein
MTMQSRHLGASALMLGVFIPTAVLAIRLLRDDSAHRAMPHVRDAGPQNMQAPPNRWDSVDQTIDESFPASDPPGNY